MPSNFDTEFGVNYLRVDDFPDMNRGFELATAGLNDYLNRAKLPGKEFTTSEVRLIEPQDWAQAYPGGEESDKVNGFYCYDPDMAYVKFDPEKYRRDLVTRFGYMYFMAHELGHKATGPIDSYHLSEGLTDQAAQFAMQDHVFPDLLGATRDATRRLRNAAAVRDRQIRVVHSGYMVKPAEVFVSTAEHNLLACHRIPQLRVLELLESAMGYAGYREFRRDVLNGNRDKIFKPLDNISFGLAEVVLGNRDPNLSPDEISRALARTY